MKNKISTLTLFSRLCLVTCLAILFTAAGYTVETIPNVRLKQGDLYVSDPDNILSTETKNKINRLLFDLEEQHTIEVAVVVVESIGHAEPRMFATDLFKHWGVGKKEDDNGLLVLLITGEGERAVVFETGYGIEGVLPDILCFRIQQNEMIPAMKEGDYNMGMLKGIEAIVRQLEEGDYEAVYTTAASGTNDMYPVWSLFFILILIGGGITGLVYGIYHFKRRGKECPQCKIKEYRYVAGKQIIPATYLYTGIRETVYQCTRCRYSYIEKKEVSQLRTSRGVNSVRVSYPNKQSSPSGRSGGSSMGRSGSSPMGGRSFGGGRSGGGGAISRF